MDSYKNYRIDKFIVDVCFNREVLFMHYLHIGISSHILNNITNNFYIIRLKNNNQILFEIFYIKQMINFLLCKG